MDEISAIDDEVKLSAQEERSQQGGESTANADRTRDRIVEHMKSLQFKATNLCRHLFLHLCFSRQPGSSGGIHPSLKVR